MLICCDAMQCLGYETFGAGVNVAFSAGVRGAGNVYLLMRCAKEAGVQKASRIERLMMDGELVQYFYVDDDRQACTFWQSCTTIV